MVNFKTENILIEPGNICIVFFLDKRFQVQYNEMNMKSRSSILMIKIKIREVVEVLNAKCIGNCDLEQYICGVGIDSRETSESNLFIPIKGMTTNGHIYIRDVVEKGALATLWNKDELNPPTDIAVILVDDTIEALQKLAGAYRNKLKTKIVGITGSNGKTSTKDITASVLSQRFKTQKTMGNYNTEIGVPYTLLSLDEDCEAAVIEMGMERKGEIDFLTRLVQPDVGIITSVGLVHIDNFPSIEEIAKAKLEIVNGIKDNGLFIYFGDDPLIENTVNNTEIKGSIRKQTFGLLKTNTLYLKNFYENLDGINFEVSDNSFGELHADMLGKHQALNSMAAILAALELGMTSEEIRLGLLKIEKTGLRNEIIKINNCTILNDCYKSNPVSIMAALDIFEMLDGDKKIAVLGDMLGYREMSNDMHYNVGAGLKKYNIHELITIGSESKFIAKGARENTDIKSIVEFDTKEEAVGYLRKYLNNNVSILIKGSRFLKLEYISNTLKEYNGD